MNMTFNLKILVHQNMNDMILAHGLTLIEVSENEVLLKSRDYAIDIIADKDGVSVIYFDTLSSPAKGYNVFLFLANKRRNSLVFSTNKPQTKSYTEFIESELGSLAQHIRNAGQDILSGSKDWIKTYSWPIVRPSGNVASII